MCIGSSGTPKIIKGLDKIKVTEPQMKILLLYIQTRWQRRHAARLDFWGEKR